MKTIKGRAEGKADKANENKEIKHHGPKKFLSCSKVTGTRSVFDRHCGRNVLLEKCGFILFLVEMLAPKLEINSSVDSLMPLKRSDEVGWSLNPAARGSYLLSY